MALGTPSTPTLPHKLSVPIAPQRLNRFISHRQKDADLFVASPPKLVTTVMQPTIAAPIRPSASQRAPFRQLYVQSTAKVPSVSMLVQSNESGTENQSKSSRFAYGGSTTSTASKSSWDWIRLNSPAGQKLTNRSEQCPNPIVSSIGFNKATDEFTVFYDPEPMDTDAAYNDSGCKYYVNDSMEIDAEDDNSVMEVDPIADMESLMDYIPMS